jgi:hypothetical protein
MSTAFARPAVTYNVLSAAGCPSAELVVYAVIHHQETLTASLILMDSLPI